MGNKKEQEAQRFVCQVTTGVYLPSKETKQKQPHYLFTDNIQKAKQYSTKRRANNAITKFRKETDKLIVNATPIPLKK